ncbi:hypothetical protein JQ607_28290 [Bradyrhizobium liaoningense]|uniref:hypothetical protein n=1 Tax=Bradyrhizobium liaoningense TaxID=43992 RepID=UPI001BA75FCB|nr:hypothetical protein [Bradyrhizobium liaoningense]MBR0844116.1 hypothetical protein [Bradyrhizobium liaoningense]
MDEQENRIVPILATDLNPLLDAADIDEPSLLHAQGGMDGKSFRSKVLAIGTKPEAPATTATTMPAAPSNEIPISLPALCRIGGLHRPRGGDP